MNEGFSSTGRVSETTPSASQATRPSEATEIHTRILRLALGLEESRSYWEHVDLSVPAPDRALQAFEQRWFGGKSLERVRFLLTTLADRYDAFPDALAVLCRFRTMDLPTRQIVCHLHLQLSDPLYRKFTGEFLPSRRDTVGSGRTTHVDRDITIRWVKTEVPDRWAEATYVQCASKLLSAASEAGLVSPKRDPRSLLFPKVTDLALGYLLHLLRGIRFSGASLENPYLASIGLTGDFLEQRLRALPGITFRRMAHLTEIDWTAPSLSAWAEVTL